MQTRSYALYKISGVDLFEVKQLLEGIKLRGRFL